MAFFRGESPYSRDVRACQVGDCAGGDRGAANQ